MEVFVSEIIAVVPVSGVKAVAELAAICVTVQVDVFSCGRR